MARVTLRRALAVTGHSNFMSPDEGPGGEHSCRSEAFSSPLFMPGRHPGTEDQRAETWCTGTIALPELAIGRRPDFAGKSRDAKRSGRRDRDRDRLRGRQVGPRRRRYARQLWRRLAGRRRIGEFRRRRRHRRVFLGRQDLVQSIAVAGGCSGPSRRAGEHAGLLR